MGTQYRSAVFTLSDDQRQAAQDAIKRAADIWSGEIVTEVTPAPTFHAGEDYHQDYFINNSQQPYCQAVVAPKVAKARQKYAHLLG